MKLGKVIKILASKAPVGGAGGPMRKPVYTELDFWEFQRSIKKFMERKVLGYSIDSRSIRKDEMFFAIRGEVHDGHQFVAEVLQRGAIAAVVAREFKTSDLKSQISQQHATGNKKLIDDELKVLTDNGLLFK